MAIMIPTSFFYGKKNPEKPLRCAECGKPRVRGTQLCDKCKAEFRKPVKAPNYAKAEQ